MGAGPRVVDWNNDGKKDLVTGERYGYIYVFLNTGTDAAPVFSGTSPYDAQKLRVNGSVFDSGYNSMLFIVDWDNDGDLDLLCGDDAYGKVRLLRNTGTRSAPAFTSVTYIKNGGGDLSVGYRSAPVVVDWNGDGKKDLLVGEMYGSVYYFENKGTDAAPVFSGSSQLKANGTALNVSWDARPAVADWNNDGALDLIVGNYYGEVYLFLAVPKPHPAKVPSGSWALYE